MSSVALRLTGQELGKLRDALVETFSPERFEELLRYRLDKRLDSFAGGNDTFNRAVFRVLENANQTLWWRDLLRAARAAVPSDPGLLELAGQFDAAPLTVGTDGAAVAGRQLELKIIDSQSTFDIGTWRRRLGEIEGRVCRIEYPPTVARGTGFLIGPNAVLTNYHVVERVISDDYLPSDIRLRFDYLVGPDGVQVSPGTAYELAEEWRVHDSPYSPMDQLSAPPSDPPPDQLDYAVLRTAVEVGNEPVGGPTDDPEPVARGWIEPSPEVYPFAAGTALYIVQHPDGLPMQVAVDSGGVLGQNGNHTRVRYTTTTQPGSSGSPCFSADWQLVALHHGGDPKYTETRHADFNQGIPLPAIRSLLADRGLAGAFGSVI